MTDKLISDLGAIGAAIADNTAFEAQRNGQTTTEQALGSDLTTYIGSKNLSYLANTATARTNLGIGGSIPFRHSGYVTGRWYRPQEHVSVVGSVFTLNTIYAAPFIAPQSITISDLASRVGTAQASKNIQFAIYASNDATCRPTGNALSSTGSITLAATGDISAALGANVSLTKGQVYWLAANSDGTTAVTAAVGQTSSYVGGMIGSATLADVWNGGSGGGIQGVSTAQTFGTWPDLTGATYTVVSNATIITAIAFKVVSIP